MDLRDINVRLDGTRYEYADRRGKPLTVAAILRRDPALRLVWNRKYSLFQVMLVTPVPRTYRIEGLGDLLVIDHTLSFQFDWMFGLMTADNPEPLLKALNHCDHRTHPELDDEQEIQARIEADRKKMEATTHENYRYAFKWNRHQLMRAFEPFARNPGFVN